MANLSETPDIIAISVTRITHDHLLVGDIEEYDFIHCDSLTRAEVVGFYIKQSLTYKQKFDINVELDFAENMWIEVQTNNEPKVIEVIYRHPTTC